MFYNKYFLDGVYSFLLCTCTKISGGGGGFILELKFKKITFLDFPEDLKKSSGL